MTEVRRRGMVAVSRDGGEERKREREKERKREREKEINER